MDVNTVVPRQVFTSRKSIAIQKMIIQHAIADTYHKELLKCIKAIFKCVEHCQLVRLALISVVDGLGPAVLVDVLHSELGCCQMTQARCACLTYDKVTGSSLNLIYGIEGGFSGPAIQKLSSTVLLAAASVVRYCHDKCIDVYADLSW